MSPCWRVRAFQGDDAKALAALHSDVMAALGERGWSSAGIRSVAEAPGAVALVAEDAARRNQGLLGFVLLRTVAGDAEILALAVVPGARRRGLARKFLDLAADAAATAGARQLFLEVAVDNGPALALYEGAGFRGLGLRRAYYGRMDGTTADALVLGRPLGDGAA